MDGDKVGNKEDNEAYHFGVVEVGSRPLIHSMSTSMMSCQQRHTNDFKLHEYAVACNTSYLQW